MATSADIVRGNDFQLNTHVSVWDDNLDAYVSYDMTGSTDVHVWLVRDMAMSERLPLHIISIEGNVVSAMVPGKWVRPEFYGVEIAWTSPNNRAKRAFRRGLLHFYNCNDEQPIEQEDSCPADTDVHIYINADVESVDIGQDTMPTQAQADWAQSDDSKPDHIKNRTHWEEVVEATLTWEGSVIPEIVFHVDTGSRIVTLRYDNGMWLGGPYTLVWRRDGGRLVLIGGKERIDIPNHYLDDPQPMRLWTEDTIIHKLDNKFLDMDTVPTEGSGKPITSDGVADALEDTAFIGDEIGSAVPPGVDFNAYTDTVWNKEQTLSQAQKDQVKENLGITCDENLSNLEIIELLGLD